ncbi:hypothetical protein [Pseudochryseolinea flava]|uniref:Uncharacterized protein n=1 Tax=Pseudochryseolinea flava TaxID=2059302 RepID=A0A364Y192_9BACT|nr:hypothetical protein [Pseudochryseolinea flava]RAV99533.1 hypothetical protein DQQ10_18185 [Pseudochryseolinea flava]
MATARRILIKDVRTEAMQALIEKNYATGRIATFDYEYREVFLDKMNYAFIVFDAYVENWIEVDLDFYRSAEEHDDFLMRVSKACSTVVLFGYEQTTMGDTRFLAWENGQVLRSIYMKSQHPPHRILMESNVGEKLDYEKNFQYADVGQDISGYKTLDFYTDIQTMFADYGYSGQERKDFNQKYVHIEYLHLR